MKTNTKLTVYHKDFDEENHIEIWEKFNYDSAWWFGGKGTSTNKGYENANDVQIRLPYSLNKKLSIKNFSIGDILVKGELNIEIDTQQDLLDYDIYNITAINNNDFGQNTHIHLSGK